MDGVIPRDAKLQDAAADVARRFSEFDAYGSEVRALAALARRAPGHPKRVYSAAFGTFLKLFERTRALLLNPDCHRPLKLGQRFMEFEDIETERMYRILEEEYPAVLPGEVRGVVAWTVYWHYLK